MKDLFKAVLRVPSVLLLFTLTLAATGCGSGVDLPTGASPVSGATIQGTVNGGTSASAAGEDVRSFASMASIRVTVVGTSLQTTTDGSGRFTIEGVPSGDVVLRFQGSGVDATVRIEGIAAGQVLTITVEINGSQARLVKPAAGQQKAEFSGSIESITPPQLRVAGRTVVTNSGTEIKRGDSRIALSSLQVGETVKVEGTQQSDGSVLAREIKANAPRATELSGMIQSINAPRFQVNGRTVMTDSATKFKGKGHIDSVADLRVGDRVEVKGTMRTDGSLLASEVKREDDDD